MRRLLGAWAVAVLVVWGCDGSRKGPPPGADDAPESSDDSPQADAGTRDEPTGLDDAGTRLDGGLPDGDGGLPDGDGGLPDGDGGTPLDGGTGQGPSVGPWPNEPLVNYSRRYSLGRVRSIGVDDAYNLWLLDGERIGVLRPGDTGPRWTSHVGQAASGFGPDKLALGSTVICGGSAGRAYVGYVTYPLDSAFIYGQDGKSHPHYNDPDPSRYDPIRYREYLKGDLDVVRLEPDGRVVLEEHLQRSARPNGPQNIGIRNTNDHHFDEDRSVLTCTKVMRGPHKGEIYIGTNHGVTRIRGLHYNSHRHPVWFRPRYDGQGRLVGRTQMAGYTYALGIGQNGDVLIGNDWNVGVVTPSPQLQDWDRVDETLNPERLNSHVRELNSLEEKDYWRGFQQTTDGRYYLASQEFGLWELAPLRRSEARASRVPGLPTPRLTALAATDDGSLFIGTLGSGLWRLDARKQLAPVQGVEGSVVRQLIYDPTVRPAVLYVLTDKGLMVLRGH